MVTGQWLKLLPGIFFGLDSALPNFIRAKA